SLARDDSSALAGLRFLPQRRGNGAERGFDRQSLLRGALGRQDRGAFDRGADGNRAPRPACAGKIQGVGSLLLGPEIDDQNLVERPSDDVAELLVRRVHKIGIAVFFRSKGQHKAIRESLAKIFHADVASPLEAAYFADFRGQSAKSVLDLLFVGRRRGFL